MRNKLCIYLAIMLLVPLASCNDDLDKFPKNKIRPENYFRNEKEMEAYSNNFYTVFPDKIYNGQVDDLITATPEDAVAGIRVIPVSGSGWSWTTLRDVNTLIEYSGNCKDEKVRVKYVALARFFRAYIYFEKVKRFGDVPWYDKAMASNDPDLKKPRDSREYIMSRVVEDLDYAIKNLPAKKELYRVSKWTALALKSRACLFEGTFRKYHGLSVDGVDHTDYLQQSVTASEEFIATSGYSLYQSSPSTAYLELSTSIDAIASETVLSRNYSHSYGVVHGANLFTLGVSMNRPGLTKKIVDSYLMTDGSRFTDKPNYKTMLFKDECVNRDPRLSQTIRTPGYQRLESTLQESPNLTYTSTGYHVIKYVVSAKNEVNKNNDNDLPLFRTPEVYLNLVEAKAELGTLQQADIDKTIRLIRDRVGMPNLDMATANANPDPYLMSATTGYPNVGGPNKGVILEIRRERAIELIMEGFRYNDMMRWKEGKTFEVPFVGMYIPAPGNYDLDGNGSIDVCFYEGTKPNVPGAVLLEINKDVFFTEGTYGYIYPHKKTVTKKWTEDRDYLYPIPTNERLLTGGSLTQNPGWDDGLGF